jgi:hypothetical protein
MKNCLGKQGLLSIFISLCMLIIFVPELSKATTGVLSSILVCRISGDYALFPVPYAIGNDLWLTDHNRSDTVGKTALRCDKVAFFGTHRGIISKLSRVSNYLTGFVNIPKAGYRQACQLLDIPPPSDTAS